MISAENIGTQVMPVWVIYKSTIRYNTGKMFSGSGGLSANQRQKIALHEMGHAIGMKDLENPNTTGDKQTAYNYILDNKLTVMLNGYTTQNSGIHALTNYTEHDIRSIQDVYGK